MGIEHFIKRLMQENDIKNELNSMTQAEVDVIADYFICTYQEIKTICDRALSQARNESY